MALVVPMVLAHGNRELATRRVLVREDGLIGSEIAEETAVIVTAETLRRTREEIEDAIAIADDDAVARIEARYGGSFPIVPPFGTFDRPTLVIAGRQDSVLGFNDQWRIFGQWPRVTYAVLDRGGHGLYIELQPLHDALINDWINRVEAESIGWTVDGRAPSRPQTWRSALFLDGDDTRLAPLVNRPACAQHAYTVAAASAIPPTVTHHECSRIRPTLPREDAHGWAGPAQGHRVDVFLAVHHPHDVGHERHRRGHRVLRRSSPDSST